MSRHKKKPSEDLFPAPDFTCGQSCGAGSSARIKAVIVSVSITGDEVQGITLTKEMSGLLDWGPGSGLGLHELVEGPSLA